MNALKLYLKLAWHCKTPFIFLFDTKYKPTTLAILLQLTHLMPDMDYIPDYLDCDDFAWVYKALACKRGINSVGLVIGWHRGLHCWNIGMTRDRIYQVEPQGGAVFQKRKGYKVLGVIS